MFCEMGITGLFINRATLKHVMFSRKYHEKQFLCGHSSLREGVFVAQLSSDARISV